MRSIAPPIIDDDATLDAIIATRHLAPRARMQAVRDQVATNYANYRTWPLASLGLAAAVADDFEDAYTNAASAMSAQRVNINAHFAATTGGMECPYCLVSQAATLDHVLPKAVFPEFAILSKNLVPCCDECQRGKGSHWRTPTGGRRHPHPYYDPADPVPLLACTLIIGTDGVGTVSYTPGGSGSATAGLYGELFRDAGFGVRLSTVAGATWSRFASNTGRLRTTGNMTLHGVRNRVQDRLDEDSHNFGIHFWRTALWKAASALGDSDLDLGTAPALAAVAL